MKLILFADGIVGSAIARWLIDNYQADVGMIVTTADNEIAAMAHDAGVRTFVFKSSAHAVDFVESEKLAFDIGLLAWWPKIVQQPLIAMPRLGFVNTHPSLLPYGRGKHYNFWSIVDRVPFGVSLHLVTEGIDSGDIVGQVELPYGWEDTGGSLHSVAMKAMVKLVQDSYPTLRSLQFETRPQDLAAGTFHYAAELDVKSRIDLDQNYNARDLINLLRARTFAGHPACTFADGNDLFEIRVDIKRKSR